MKADEKTKSVLDKKIDEQLKAMSFADRAGLLLALKEPAYKSGYGTGLLLADKLNA